MRPHRASARGRLRTPRPVATSALARPVRRGSPAEKNELQFFIARGKKEVFGLRTLDRK